MKKGRVLVALTLSLAMVASGWSAYAAVANQRSTAQVSGTQEANEQSLRLWYTKPASQGDLILSAGAFGTTKENNIWQQQTLPIGNGRMGANVYGEIASEHLTFNEKTLWTGGPSDSRPDYNGGNLVDKGQNGAVMQQIQSLFAEGRDSEASNMCNQLVGAQSGYGAYQAFGDVYLDFADMDTSDVTDYVRDLDLTTGVASVHFTSAGTAYTREYFISYPDNVLAMKLTAEGGSALNFDVRFPSKQGAAPEAEVADGVGTITVAGEVSDNQMQFNAQLQAVVPEGATVEANGAKLTVAGADEAVLFVSAATDYENEYPDYRTGQTADELDAQVAEDVDAAVAAGYDAVRESHLADYQGIFSRLALDLGQEPSQVPTDELLKAYKGGTASDAEQRELEVMLFQFGRYLLISSSREGSLPANLQGVWNDRAGDWNYVPWGSDYHMNVNLQMNYWPAYSTNMAECAIPLVEYVDSLREPGRVTAEVYAGVASDEDHPENGFMAHTQNTPFGWTCPGWDFSWGWSPAAVPWILQNCWEYYEYTGDEEYLETTIYPMLKEEAALYSQMLVEDEETGRLVSSPTYSPEQGPRTNGNAYEQELIWQLYEDAIKAAEILDTDAELVSQWRDIQSKLDPIEIGDSGQIKEWYDETTLGSIGSAGHRHMSHLLGLYPGDLISVDTPEWMDAAIVSLKDRGDVSTGWGMGQRINTWARTGDGEHAYELIRSLFNNGIYPNLWDTHPPFQIDGNFGMTSGVSEMLLQSNQDYINLLPAIPDEWADGSASGFVARGNFLVDMQWADGSLTDVSITSQNGGVCVMQNKLSNLSGATVTVNGQAVKPEILSDNRIAVETEPDDVVAITDIPAAEKPVEPTTIDVEDAVQQGGVWVTNPEITYAGNWTVWDGEASKHHGSTETEISGASAVGSSITYTFTGTGIEVYSPKNPRFSSFKILIDGEDKGTYSLYCDADSGLGQQKVASFLDLADGEHTIKLEAVEREGVYKWCFDYFKVYQNP